jgi:hypothetical protein
MEAPNRELVDEAIVAVNETYRTGDMDPWRRYVKRVCDPDILLEAPTDAFTEGEWRGHEGAVGFVANQMDALEGMWLRLDEVTEVTPNCLLAAITFGGRARYSELEVELHPFHVFTMRGGKTLKWQIFRERQQALDAALSAD